MKWLDKYQSGGDIKKDNRGYWNPDNWGKPVQINSNQITMKGVNQPLIGISDEGDIQYMEPGNDYQFEGSNVVEYPIALNGNVMSDNKSLNSNIQSGWLSKY